MDATDFWRLEVEDLIFKQKQVTVPTSSDEAIEFQDYPGLVKCLSLVQIVQEWDADTAES